MAKVLQNALAAFTEYMEDNDSPPCFTKAEYKVWKTLEQDAPTVPVRRFVCRDCSAKWQKKMITENKCFLRSWDNDIQGFVRIPVEKIAD